MLVGDKRFLGQRQKISLFQVQRAAYASCLGWLLVPGKGYGVMTLECVYLPTLNYVSQDSLSCMFLVRMGSDSYFVFHAHCSWSTNSSCWCEAAPGSAGIPPPPRSSFSFSDSWARFVCSLLWWRALPSVGYLCHQGQKQQEEVTASWQVAFKPLCNLDFIAYI